MYFFEDTTFVNTVPEAVAYLEDPNPDWANPDDCGDFSCTFPNNVFLKFTSNTWTNNAPTWAASDFHIVHYQDGVVAGFDANSEVLLTTSNAAFLDTQTLAVIAFESLDSDKRDRSS